MPEFTVHPFAFMRLTHDALRAGFAKLRAAADAGDLAALRAAYPATRQVIALHAAQEERAFFPLLDDLFEGVTEKAALREAHQREAAYQERFEAALEAGDAELVRGALANWTGSFEEHLVHEEEVMMPLTPRTADTLEGRARHVRRIMEVDWRALAEVQIPWVVAALAETKPYGPVRMFVAALEVSAGDAWGELQAAVRGALQPELVRQLEAHGHLAAA
ncbi:MAG: hypothetical protein EP329_02735 [Deltaproteobacteria bacterium]|nr:MAG: hypothetical protein EP329_02735 [Deltaproteobacteria bacterium]